MRRFVGSVRWRMTWWYSISIALIYLLFSGCVFLTFRYSCIAESRMRLDNELASVTHAVARASNRPATVEADFPRSNFFVTADHGPHYASSGWIKAGIPASLPVDSNGYAFGVFSAGRHYVIRTTHLRLGNDILQIGVANDNEQTYENVSRLSLILIISVPGVLFLSLLSGYFLAGSILSPIEAMTRKARRITADDLSHRLPTGGIDDEFSRLAQVFNETLGRLEDAFDRMKRFTADASHELRTPLAVIRNLGENALQGTPNVVSHGEALGSILEEVDRLTRLLDGLLVLTRVESAQLPLNFNVVSLNEISLDVMNCLHVLAEEKGQTLEFASEAELSVKVDDTTFKQALINLIANAIQYTQAGGTIAVRIKRSASKHALVEVDDNGPGIAAEHREKIFERFYRIEKDRSQATGGSGLGLAIARWAIGLNGGTVTFEAKQNGGSIFRIALAATDVSINKAIY